MLRKNHQAFTIVELLIVIVVIAILAAISVVAFTGIQRRATNAGIIDAASSTIRAVQAYIAVNGRYPMTTGNACVTTQTGCLGEGGGAVSANSTFDTAMGTIGTLPRSVPIAYTDRSGIYLTNNPGITFEGSSQPLLMVYFLSGLNQNCGVNNVSVYTWPNLILSTTGYSSNSGGATRCWVSVPGPSA